MWGGGSSAPNSLGTVFGELQKLLARCLAFSLSLSPLRLLPPPPVPVSLFWRDRRWAGWREETTEGRKDGERDGENEVWRRQGLGTGGHMNETMAREKESRIRS